MRKSAQVLLNLVVIEQRIVDVHEADGLRLGHALPLGTRRCGMDHAMAEPPVQAALECTHCYR